jgi:hypothetical protein
VLAMSSRIASLESCLPMCMHCRAVKDGTQQWQKLERYVHEHAQVNFSHGFCPDCYFAEVLEPELRVEGLAPTSTDTVDPAALARFEELAADELPEVFAEISTWLEHSGPRALELVGELRSHGRLEAAKRDWLTRFADRARVVGAERLRTEVQGALATAGRAPTAALEGALADTLSTFARRAGSGPTQASRC